ncbi:MAG: hypothetical protein GC134_01915 [Proteobacteria bacterium]|nr:hypothetical protein [Pseudomonadota bacterium]
MNDQTIQEWHQNEFLPWKEAMLKTRDMRVRFSQKVRQHAAELKYIVSLLLEHRGREAVRHWNRLELEPALQMLELSADRLVIETLDGEKFAVPIDALLTDLQKMVEGKTTAPVMTAQASGS